MPKRRPYEDILGDYKRESKRAAKDLKYPSEVLSKIDKCESVDQISAVMATYRNRI